MNFLYRHRVIFGLTGIALAVIVTFGVCFFALARTAAANTQRLTIVIDAGHGGIDGGVVGRVSGVKESDINLSISRCLQKEFEQAGFRVVQTRPTEAGLYGTATAGYKKRDMQKRAEIIQENAPALVISVHQNFFSMTSRRGAQVFFRNDSSSSRTLACAIQTAFNEMPETAKKYSALAGDYYVLNCSDYPSVIVECGFLSNPEDEALLITQDYQKKVASVIAQGALSYLACGSSAA
ncbi:MAG: N-acetylmuramoyl-L-alanine amidase [Clostridia bacterium]|jgi:N-acetylmuramoyl-L-alanine amidase|nr:N-acetylmuramoyl-L-alanine amidase [Clostridia bacterium]